MARTRPLCLRRKGEERTTDSPSSAAARSSTTSSSVDRASRSTSSGSLDVPVDDALGGGPDQLRDLAYDGPGLFARTPQRRPGYDGSGDQRDAASDQGVGPPDERRTGGRHQGAHHDGLDGRLADEQHALAEHQRSRHRERDDERDLPAAGAQPVGQQVAHEHPDRDTDRHLGNPPQPLSVAGAQADDRSDRREEGRLVTEHVARQRPRDPRGNGALADLPRLGTHAGTALAHRDPAAGHRQLEVRSGGGSGAGQALARATPGEWIHGRGASSRSGSAGCPPWRCA